MKKKLVFIIAIGTLLTTFVSGCSALKNNVDFSSSTVESDITDSFSKLAEPIESSASFNEANIETSTSVEVVTLNASEFFKSDSTDLKAKSINFSGPMCTELVIENSKKEYFDTLTSDYPVIEFEPKNKITSIGWWTDQQDVCIQFWNVNNEKEVHFSIDGATCTLTLPETIFETVKLNSVINNSGLDYTLDSMQVYQDAAVLNLHVTTKELIKLPTIKLKSQKAEHIPYSVDINDSTGEIKILYLLEKTNIKDAISGIQGIICNNQVIAFN